MKFRVLIHFCLTFVLAACAAPTPPPSTATQTASPTPIPATYYFAPHTADEAQKIILQAEKAILEDIDYLEMPLSQYSYYHRAAFYAAWNAIIRFPDAPRADIWKWKLAYYAALSGESTLAADIYIQKIEQALNEKKLRVEELPEWFQSGELKNQYPTLHFDLETQPISLPGKETAYLVSLGVLRGIDVPGSMCLLIAEEKGKATTYLVYDGFYSGGFFPTLRNPSHCTLADVTGDGIDEIIGQNWSGGHIGTVSLEIFDISHLPPRALSFNASGDLQISAWIGSVDEFIHVNGKVQIPISEKLGQCDMYLRRYLEWNGAWFDLTDVSFQLTEGGRNSLKDCYHYLPLQPEKIGTLDAIQILDEAIRAYSPGSKSEKEILEQLRVQKGLLYLFAGSPDEARSVFEDILNNPLKQDGIWIVPVKNFLEIYQEPSDLYRACAALTACDPNRSNMIEDPLNRNCMVINPCHMRALGEVMSAQPQVQSLESFTAGLRAASVDIAGEGWVDLDHDGKDEFWFTIDPPTHLYYDLWILAEGPDRIHIVNVGAFPDAIPEFRVTAITSQRALVEMDRFGRALWIRDPRTHEPLWARLNEGQDPNDTTDYKAINADLQELEKLQSQFYSGEDPVGIYEKLLEITNRYPTCPYEIASPYYKGTAIECGDYYYLLGFAAELAHDNETAQTMYAIVSEQYPAHPLTLLARKKLAQ